MGGSSAKSEAGPIVEVQEEQPRLQHQWTLLQETKKYEELLQYLQCSCLSCMPSFLGGTNMYNKEVDDLARSPEFKDKIVPMGLCTGPAISIAKTSALIGWICLLVLSFVAFTFSKADDDDFVFYPLWLWVPFAPLVLGKLYAQHKCLRYTTIPYVQCAGRFRVCACIDAGFGIWYAMTSIMTVSQVVDYGTDSFFIAVVLRAGWDPAGRFEMIWHEVMLQSYLTRISGICSHLTLANLAKLSYSLMLLQPVVAFLRTYPCRYERSVKPEYEVGKGVNYQNCFGQWRNMGDVLYDLADVAHYAAIQVQSPDFPSKKAALLAENLKVPSTDETDDVVKEHERIHRICSLTHNALNRSLVRIFLVTILENTFQANLQVSVLGLFLCITKNSAEISAGDESDLTTMKIQTCLSIALSVLQAVIRCGEVIRVSCFGIWTIRKLWDSRELDPDDEAKDATDAVVRQISHNALPLSRNSSITLILAKVALILFFGVTVIGLTGYAAVKLYFTLFHCENHLWNVTGCVALPKFYKDL